MYCDHTIEQDHHGIKQRYYPMRGFGSFAAAARFCTAHDELRDHLRHRQHLNQMVSLADQRGLFQERWGEVCAILEAAWARSGGPNPELTRAPARLHSES